MTEPLKTLSFGEALAVEGKILKKALADMCDAERLEYESYWPASTRSEQFPPRHDWHVWLIMAGRGFGKTRAGAEWVREIALRNGNARIALVAANMHEARSVMVEGASGILAVTPDGDRPHYEPSLRRLVWPGGARATLYSAAEPDSLRGPEHSHAWCDEIAKWDISPIGLTSRAELAWDNLEMGLRVGKSTQILATTTPKPVGLVRRLITAGESGKGDVTITRGSTYANAANLSRRFIARMQENYGHGNLGRQEIDGELLADVEGALWNRALLERCRIANVSNATDYVRVIVAVDPPATANGDACGIIVAGLLPNRCAHIFADCSVKKPAPHVWAAAVANAAELWNAERVVAEANQGGDMVRSVLQAASITLPVKLVCAVRGKSARAEPVAALYEAGRIFHAGEFGALEDQLCGLMTGGAYMGPGRSPDRADALVWAVHELLLAKGVEPRIWVG